MDADDYRGYLRNRVLLLACLAVAIGAARWTGLLAPSSFSGMEGRAFVLQIIALVIAVGWVAIAVIGLIGLVRWVRAE
ncbi:hypothetical protein [Natronorubrum sp. DTA7]|uniref:hypothetical protein n=1 Tax=Natronorubrum sp. DTA7 TaxID=3447016 RepID=UPI003F866BC8